MTVYPNFRSPSVTPTRRSQEEESTFCLFVLRYPWGADSGDSEPWVVLVVFHYLALIYSSFPKVPIKSFKPFLQTVVGTSCWS